MTRPDGERLAWQRWYNMVRRCTDPTDRDYEHYGARGVKVCAQWLTFSSYYADTGDRPSRYLTLDRVDNDGDYEPSNVRWATYDTQNSNRRNAQQSRVACPSGHPLSGDNLYVYPDGRRSCRVCRRADNRSYKVRLRERVA